MVPVRQWPLWVRYVIAFAFAAAVVVALVLYVDAHQSQSEGLPASPSRAQAAQTAREDRVVVEQQQAPHVVRASGTGRDAARAAVTHFMRTEVAHAFIVGPLDGAISCRGVGSSATRQALRCRATAGERADRLEYPFDVVVDPARRTVTFCQVVASPDAAVPSPPVSSRCR